MTQEAQQKFIGSFDLSCLPSIDEFDKRYAGSYMLVKTPSQMEDVFYYEGYGGQCVFTNDRYGRIKLNLETESVITPIFPKTGLFNPTTGKGAVFTCKVPVRQNRRSMSDKNVKFEDPVLSAYRAMRKSVQMNFQLIRDSLSTYYPPSIEATKEHMEATERFSVAFSPEYMLSLGKRSDEFFLWYKAVPVGMLKGKNIKVDSHYAQELKDFLRDNGQREYFVEEMQ